MSVAALRAKAGMEWLMRRGSCSKRANCHGFTYVTVMALLAVLGVGLAALGPIWSMAAQRERERELLRVGAAYAQAIASYHRMSPGTPRQFPASVDDLIEDRRFVRSVRHLRTAYTDPMRPGVPLALVRGPDGALRGVRSTSGLAPLRKGSIALPPVSLAAAETYADWQFVPRVVE